MLDFHTHASLIHSANRKETRKLPRILMHKFVHAMHAVHLISDGSYLSLSHIYTGSYQEPVYMRLWLSQINWVA